jgi:YD repeat-containing protein
MQLACYDKLDHLKILTDPLNHITAYGYTKSEEPNIVTDAESNKTSNITKYDYDVLGRLHCATYPDNTTEEFTYDKNSNILSRKNRGGDTIYFGYDALNRMIWKRRPNEPNMTFAYDIAGRLTENNDNSKLTSYYYDRIGRVKEVIDSEDRSVKYNYDELGRRTRLTYPVGYKY